MRESREMSVGSFFGAIVNFMFVYSREIRLTYIAYIKERWQK